MHDRNLRDFNVLHVPEDYSAMALSSTKFQGAKLRNNLPLDIRKLDDVTHFKKALHRHFVESYVLIYKSYQLRSVVLEVGVGGGGGWSHPMVTVGCGCLSLFLAPASRTPLLNSSRNVMYDLIV